MFISKFIIFIVLNEHYLIVKIESKCSNETCPVLSAINRYGRTRNGNCFQISVSKLREIVVYTDRCVVGFTFKFLNGTILNYFERKTFKRNYTVDLTNNKELIGVDLKVGIGVESIQFHFNNSISTEMMGESPDDYLLHLNSSFLNLSCLQIHTISGCIDDKNLQYYPFMAFSYYFSLCSRIMRKYLKFYLF
jgi:hypothetical protein